MTNATLDKFGYPETVRLMMVDPDVHFHVILRCAQERRFVGAVFRDASRPRPPDLSRTDDMGDATREDLRQHLLFIWE